MDGAVPPAPNRGSTDPPADREMAEGRRIGRWEMVEDGSRDSARLGDFAAARERLPALRFRSLGAALADAPDHGRHYRGPLRGRHGAGVPASWRCRTVPPGLAGPSAEVRTGTTSG